MRNNLPSSAFVGLCLMAGACGAGNGSTLAPSPGPTALFAARLEGYVDDAAFRPMAGATVEVLAGPQAGASALTDADGKFSLNAATTTDTRVRATKAGYQPATLPLPQAGAISAGPLTFFLAADRSSGNRATLTFDADPACLDLPASARNRTYDATVVGNAYSPRPNTAFYVNLEGPSLGSYFHFVSLRAVDGAITFDLSDNGIEDEVAPEEYIFIGGVASTSAQPGAAAISAALIPGLLDYCVVPSDPGAAYPCTDQALRRIQCASGKHQLTLRWR